MNRWAWALMLVLVPAGAAGAGADDAQKAQPFYRKYLVPGNRLDDQILEQERRVEASPQDASLRNDFGNLLAQRHFPDEAAKQYEIASKLDKKDFISYYNLGLLREIEGKISQAISAYQKAINRKRGFPQAHFRLGRLYEQAGRTDAAVEEYANAMRIDPAMRDPRRNPLVVDSELIYQASLVNYKRDVAATSMVGESVFVEENRFRSMPVDRMVSSVEVSLQEEPEPNTEPRQIGTGNAAGAGGAPEGTAAPASPRRPVPRATSSEAPTNPLGGRPRPASATAPAPGMKPPRSGAPAAVTPPPAVPPPAVEPEVPPESMPEPTPTEPDEVEPS